VSLERKVLLGDKGFMGLKGPNTWAGDEASGRLLGDRVALNHWTSYSAGGFGLE
jgi:hypothetical protein